MATPSPQQSYLPIALMASRNVCERGGDEQAPSLALGSNESCWSHVQSSLGACTAGLFLRSKRKDLSEFDQNVIAKQLGCQSAVVRTYQEGEPVTGSWEAKTH